MQSKAKPTPAVAPTASGIAAASPDVSPEAIAALVAQGAAVLAVEAHGDAVDDIATIKLKEFAAADALDLLVGVTHDMRSPLSSMMVLVDRLRSGHAGPVTPAQERQLGLLYSAVFGLATLTNDALDCARGTRQLTGAEPVALSVVDIFAAVRSLVQPIAEERGLVVRWSTSVRDRRRGHAAAVHRVLLNLVTNALNNTSRGSVSVTAEASDDGKVAFAVIDSGKGMPAQILARYSASEPAESMPHFSSSGLGLALCEKLVGEMGGSLSLENFAEGGAACRFAVLLPPVN